MRYRRINLWGGPCCGKSTFASYLFYKLKEEGFRIEYVQEFVKTWCYEERQIKGFDQVFLFANQLRSEEVVLRSNISQLVVTDSPLLMNAWYGKYNNAIGWQGLLYLANKFEKEYPSINILIERDEENFDPHARLHTKEESQIIDEEQKQFLLDTNPNLLALSFDKNQDALANMQHVIYSLLSYGDKVLENENSYFKLLSKPKTV